MKQVTSFHCRVSWGHAPPYNPQGHDVSVPGSAIPTNLGQMAGVRVKTHKMYNKTTHSDEFLL